MSAKFPRGGGGYDHLADSLIICNIKEKTTLKGLSIVVSCAGIQDLRSLKNDQNYVFSSLKRSVFADFLCYLQCNKIQTDVLKQTLELLPS